MYSNNNHSSNGFHHTPDGQPSEFISPDQLLKAARHPIHPALLCSEDCAHPSMKAPPSGKGDGDCRKRWLNEAVAILDELERKVAVQEAASEEQGQKRHRGGQPGNQNARKYTLLPRPLSKKELE
jgi:hypothetical protein